MMCTSVREKPDVNMTTEQVYHSALPNIFYSVSQIG